MYYLSATGIIIASMLLLKNIYDASGKLINLDKLDREKYCQNILDKDPNFSFKIAMAFILFIFLIIISTTKLLPNNDFILLVICIVSLYIASSFEKAIYLISICYYDFKRKLYVTNYSGNKIPAFIMHILLILFALLLSFSTEILAQIIGKTLVIFIIPSVIGELIAIIKKRLDDKKIMKIDRSIYLRELPNNYGIGINSLLMNSNIENDKDITAAILDLCAKGYLLIRKENNKYTIKVLKNIDDKLFSNEKYILENVINNNIKKIDYHSWYNLCVEDGKSLNIYIPVTKKRKLKDIIFDFLKKINNMKWNVFTLIIFGLFSLFIICFILLVILIIAFMYLFYRLFCLPFVVINSYNTAMGNNLKRTDKGILEYQKLVSFRNFIKDFGAFANREAKEVVIWDRYLSYAQVFGLTKEIMQTGYNELVNNASFQIDNIDNINLDNIEVLM